MKLSPRAWPVELRAASSTAAAVLVFVWIFLLAGVWQAGSGREGWTPVIVKPAGGGSTTHFSVVIAAKRGFTANWTFVLRAGWNDRAGSMRTVGGRVAV